jgi:hypothetical protein
MYLLLKLTFITFYFDVLQVLKTKNKHAHTCGHIHMGDLNF